MRLHLTPLGSLLMIELWVVDLTLTANLTKALACLMEQRWLKMEVSVWYLQLIQTTEIVGISKTSQFNGISLITTALSSMLPQRIKWLWRFFSQILDGDGQASSTGRGFTKLKVTMSKNKFTSLSTTFTQPHSGFPSGLTDGSSLSRVLTNQASTRLDTSTRYLSTSHGSSSTSCQPTTTLQDTLSSTIKTSKLTKR